MVIIVHKLPVGSFIFLQCLSETKLLNLSGTPYNFRNATKAATSIRDPELLDSRENESRNLLETLEESS
jgi:hypothetical protein